MLIDHTTFPSFLQPTFWQCHLSPCHMDIYNSQSHGSQFRKNNNLILLCFVKITYINAWFQYVFVPMCSVWYYPIDYITIFHLCKVFINLHLCFVKMGSCLRDLNRCDDWHLYISCSYQPHMHLAHLAKGTLSPVLSWLILYTCLIVTCKCISLLVNLYDHAPHVCYCMYYFLFVW